MHHERKIRRSAIRERALIVGIKRGRLTRRRMEVSLLELGRLVDTAGAVVAGEMHQDVKRIDPATFIGRGKAAEIAAEVERTGADIVVIDDELTPVQNKNLEDITGVFVLDRTAIILDIFARRARSKEGKLQVELAQLRYLAPRLVGRGKTLSQQVGRIGTRGPGETALEYDRRRVRERITRLASELEGVRSHRRIHRIKREAVPIPLISLVGYTNAGKSTLLNALTDAGVFVEDKLFATLDPTVRRLRLPSGRHVLIADTVGFISRLPHELVEAFKSTFEEVSYAHLIIHVIDGSDDEAGEEANVVERVLSEMGLGGKPCIVAINKCDVGEDHYRHVGGEIKISALRGDGLSELLERIDVMLRHEFRRVVMKIPVERGDILSNLYRLGYVWKVVYGEDGVLVDCELHEKFIGKYKEFEVR